MIEFITTIGEACKDNPNFTFIIVVVLLQLFLLLGKHIKILVMYLLSKILKDKFNLDFDFLTPRQHNEMIKIINSYTSDLGISIDFKPHLVCANNDLLKSSLEYIIEYSRDNGTYLVLNFSALVKTSEPTIQTINKVLSTAMDKNNVRMTIIYPDISENETDKEKKYINGIFQDLIDYCKFRSKTIEVLSKIDFIKDRRS